METRKMDWFDIETRKVYYSFQVKVGGRWANVSEGGKPCVYETAKEREDARASVRKINLTYEL